jgi:hypothetical protein
LMRFSSPTCSSMSRTRISSATRCLDAARRACAFHAPEQGHHGPARRLRRLRFPVKAAVARRRPAYRFGRAAAVSDSMPPAAALHGKQQRRLRRLRVAGCRGTTSPWVVARADSAGSAVAAQLSRSFSASSAQEGPCWPEQPPGTRTGDLVTACVASSAAVALHERTRDSGRSSERLLEGG